MNFSRLTFELTALVLFSTAVYGAEPQRITNDGRLKSDLIFTYDTQELIFSTLKNAQLIKLERLNLDSGKRTDFHPSANTNELSLSFGKGMKFYAYIRNDGNLHTALEVQDVETGEKYNLNPGGGFAAVRGLTMHPNGQEIVFAFPDKNGSQQIWHVNNRLQNKTALTDTEYIDGYPKYSPNGTTIAFTSTRSGNFDIYRMSASGTGVFQLTDHPGLDTRPAWSPDGSRIVYTSLVQGNYDIYVMGADGSNQKRITTNPGKDDFACWHPDGKKILFTSEVKGKTDIFSMLIQ